MIFGIGTDIVELSRIEKTYNRFGNHFVERLLMPEENTLFSKNKNPIRFLAMRFAAKEAIVKAMGTGFSNGIWIRDIGIINKNSGKPVVVYSSRGDLMCRKLGISEIHISLTDEAGLILAFSVALKSDSNL
ncbi:MAG TPA: holo-ACP synthase [Woeseiaceae bacterium]|nr:holo-ACP synthase [Woeseiaceae bacterium]|tara:strand:+ start:2061 stop:2453 length:393 start_codon:yes stop_codon:yes gene_type:complete